LVGQRRPASNQLRFQIREKDRYDDARLFAQDAGGGATSSFPAVFWRMCPSRSIESFVSAIMDNSAYQDIRLATKGLMGIPQHFFADEVLHGLDGSRRNRRERASRFRRVLWRRFGANLVVVELAIAVVLLVARGACWARVSTVYCMSTSDFSRTPWPRSISRYSRPNIQRRIGWLRQRGSSSTASAACQQ